MQVNVTSNVPPLDEDDIIAQVLYEVYNDGQFKDSKFGDIIFTKPYLDQREQHNINDLQARQFYCDELQENKPFSFGFREWGFRGQKFREILAAKGYRLTKIEALPAGAGATEGVC